MYLLSSFFAYLFIFLTGYLLICLSGYILNKRITKFSNHLPLYCLFGYLFIWLYFK